MNLLVALQALLEEQHVSRAAERIGVTQPAASALLARLRRHFGDPLLERRGNRYTLTPLGVQLREQVGGVMQSTDRLFATKSEFDPGTTEREFTLMASDYLVTVFGPRLLAAFQAHAPRATLRFRHFGNLEVDHPEIGATGADAIITPRGTFALDMPSLPLFSDEWVALVDAANPIAERSPEAGELAGMSWVLGQFEPRESPFMLRRLVERGTQLRPHAVIGSFVALPLFIAGSDRIAIIQDRLTRALPLPPTVRVVPCPFDVGPINEALWWHPVHTHDSGHQWLRALIRDTAGSLDDDSGTPL